MAQTFIVSSTRTSGRDLPYLCFYANLDIEDMRTTVDLPDTLFRRAKATAAIRGVSLKDLLITAIER
jgi:hypothetical protein